MPLLRKLVLLMLSPLMAMAQPAGRIALPARTVQGIAEAADNGPMPASQRLTLSLTLAPDVDRVAALDRFLAAVTDPGAPEYHHWVTPQEFAARYGATEGEIGAARAWAESASLTVESVSAAATRITLSGYPAQVQRAFAVELHALTVRGTAHYAAVGVASLQPAAAALFSSVEGLDDVGAPGLSPAALAAVVDGNAQAVLAIDAATAELAPAQVAAYAGVFQQAAAQGMTTLVMRGPGMAADFADLTAVTVDPATIADLAQTPRPTWQAAPGLPADGLRHTPDLTVSSLAAFAQAIAAILAESPGTTRLGNVAPQLYALAPTPGLFAQGDSSAGTWQPGTGLGRVDLAALVRAFPHGSAAAALTVTSSASSPVHGGSFTLTAGINSASGGGVPTGTITFTSSNVKFPTTSVALDGSGKAVTTAFMLAGGAYPIVATYAGDATYANTSATTNVTVQPEAAIFTVSAPATVTLGSAFTATVSLGSASGFGTPAASITVTPSGITSAQPITQSLSGSGGTASGQFGFTTNMAGTVALQASCTSADSSFTCYTPQTANITVPQAAPGITLTVSPANPTAGTPVTLSAPVTGVAGIPVTGSVQFFDGANSIGFGSAPNATYSGLLLAGSTHPITAVYQGDANYLKATSTQVNVPVGTAATNTTVSASALSTTFGQNVTLNIGVDSPASVNGSLPGGTLTFTGIPGITSAPISGGATTLTLSSLVAGTYTITTKYSGDSNYSPSTGNILVLTVMPSVASINASLSTPTFTTGSTSTLTVTITLPGTAQLPAGTMFLATIPGLTGGSYPGTFTINTGGNTGTGSVVIPAPPKGMYSLQVTCPANANFTCNPQTLSISSTAVGVAVSGTSLSVSPAKPVSGQPTVLTASVSGNASSAPAATGTVTFFDGTTKIGTGTLMQVNNAATAMASVILTGAAAHSLTAVYSGDAVFATSTSAAVIVTTSAAPAIALTSSVTSSTAGLNVVLTTTLTGTNSAGGAPTGTVSYYLAGSSPTLLGTSVVSSSATGVSIATFATTLLPSGSNGIYAVYSGDTFFATVTSSTISVGVTDYTLTFVPATISVTRGRSVSVTGVLGALNGFNGSVLLSCIPPADTGITCSLSPSTLSGGGATTTLTINTSTTTRATLDLPHPAHLLGGISCAALLCFLLPRRRRLPAVLLMLLGLALLPATGCGNTASALSGGTPLGTVNLSINSASGVSTLRHNYTYQVTVQ